MIISVYFLFVEFLFKFFFQNDDQLLIKFHEILTSFQGNICEENQLFMFDL